MSEKTFLTSQLVCSWSDLFDAIKSEECSFDIKYVKHVFISARNSNSLSRTYLICISYARRAPGAMNVQCVKSRMQRFRDLCPCMIQKFERKVPSEISDNHGAQEVERPAILFREVKTRQLSTYKNGVGRSRGVIYNRRISITCDDVRVERLQKISLRLTVESSTCRQPCTQNSVVWFYSRMPYALLSEG